MYPDELEINVIQEDIDAANAAKKDYVNKLRSIFSWQSECPVAHAIRRQYGFSKVSVTVAGRTVVSHSTEPYDDYAIYSHTPELDNYIANIDRVLNLKSRWRNDPRNYPIVPTKFVLKKM